MRAIDVSVRVAPVRGSSWELRLLKFFIIVIIIIVILIAGVGVVGVIIIIIIIIIITIICPAPGENVACDVIILAT